MLGSFKGMLQKGNPTAAPATAPNLTGAHPEVQVITPPPKEKTSFDKLLRFLQKIFLFACFDRFQSAAEPTPGLVEILSCRNSSGALRLLLCMTVHKERFLGPTGHPEPAKVGKHH